MFSPVLFGTELVEYTLDALPHLSPDAFGLFGIDSEVTLGEQRSPVVLQEDLTINQELLLNFGLKSPGYLGELVLENDIELLPDLLAPVVFDTDIMVLPESTILLDHGLPIPIIAGSGGILSVFRTAVMDEPFLQTSVPFGKMTVFQAVPYGGTCCPN